MPNEDRTCCRWTVTVIHVTMCLIAGACILSVTLLRGERYKCLPSLTDNSGREVQYDTPVLDIFCEILLYAAGGISGWSILSFFIHCCWENKLCFAVQTVMYVLITVLCMTGSASFSTHFLLWCENLQTMFKNASTCDEAAKFHDRFFPGKLNMSVYYETNIIQQCCSWSLAFLAFLLAFIYISLLCISTPDYTTTRVVYLRDTETSPLIPPPGERE